MENIQYYYSLATIMAVASVLMLGVTIVIWRKLDVRSNMSALSGTEARRNIDKIRRDAASGRIQADHRKKGAGSIISWNSSDRLAEHSIEDKTIALSKEELFAGEAYGQEKTSYLEIDKDFIIEREERIK